MLGNGLSMLMGKEIYIEPRNLNHIIIRIIYYFILSGPGLVTVPSNCSTDINRMSLGCPDKVQG